MKCLVEDSQQPYEGFAPLGASRQSTPLHCGHCNRAAGGLGCRFRPRSDGIDRPVGHSHAHVNWHTYLNAYLFAHPHGHNHAHRYSITYPDSHLDTQSHTPPDSDVGFCFLLSHIDGNSYTVRHTHPHLHTNTYSYAGAAHNSGQHA